MAQRKVLFLCTGNSCRSQMAEGMVNHFLAEDWVAYSAGTQPAGFVHPMAIDVMAEIGIDINGGRSKPVDEFQDVHFDMVITVCDGAAEACPLWLREGRVVHIGFPDPAGAAGSREHRLVVFRGVRDAIRARVLEYLGGVE
jgi:arsenate reductase